MNHDRGGEYAEQRLVLVTSRSRTTEDKINWGKSAAMADRSSFASCCRAPNQINLVFDGSQPFRYIVSESVITSIITGWLRSMMLDWVINKEA